MAGSHGAGVSVCKDLLDEVVQPAHVELPHNVFSLVQLHLVFYQLVLHLHPVVTWSPKRCTLPQEHLATRCSSRTHRVTESSSRFWSTSLRASLLPGLDSASRWQNMVGGGREVAPALQQHSFACSRGLLPLPTLADWREEKVSRCSFKSNINFCMSLSVKGWRL